MFFLFERLTSLFRAPLPSHGDHQGDEIDEREVSLKTSKLEVEDGWMVGEQVERVPTARTQALQRLLGGVPVGFCWHWTATRGVGRRLAERIKNLPKKGERSASWGTLIPREGPMILSAPLNVGTWHAGGPSAHAFNVTDTGVVMAKNTMADKRPGQVSANSCLHGIEIENVGELRSVTRLWNVRKLRYEACEPQWRGWPFEGGRDVDQKPGPLVPVDEVVGLGKKSYHSFSDHQIWQASRIIRLGVSFYGMKQVAASYDHSKIDPSRKTDAGPLWQAHLSSIFDSLDKD